MILLTIVLGSFSSLEMYLHKKFEDGSGTQQLEYLHRETIRLAALLLSIVGNALI